MGGKMDNNRVSHLSDEDNGPFSEEKGFVLCSAGIRYLDKCFSG
jgi:hypothetical protein